MPKRLIASFAVGCAGVMVAAAPAAATTTGVPYSDPNAHGVIGLCNRAGQQITHGSVAARPFAWRAVSSVAAPTGYRLNGTATLLAYQPRKGVDAGAWSGDSLTSASRFSNAAHPIAAATSGDESLRGFLTEFRPTWDGLLQLRMYLGAPDQPVYSLSYPALTIKVTGNTWHVVGRSTVSCHSGRAVSLESIVLHPRRSGHGASPSRNHASAPDVSTAGAPAPAAATFSAARPAHSSGDTTAIPIGAGCAVVVLAGGWFLRRRFTAQRAGATTAPHTEQSKKGT